MDLGDTVLQNCIYEFCKVKINLCTMPSYEIAITMVSMEIHAKLCNLVLQSCVCAVQKPIITVFTTTHTHVAASSLYTPTYLIILEMSRLQGYSY